jgi:hypothetical protein
VRRRTDLGSVAGPLRSTAATAGGRRQYGGGLLWLTAGPDTPSALLLVAFALVGLGFGLVNAPITSAAVAGMPAAQAGTAAGLASTSRQVGTALGVAMAGSLTGTTGRDVAAVSAGFADAARPVWAVLAALGVAIAGAAVLGSTARARRSAAAVGSRLEAADRAPSTRR